MADVESANIVGYTGKTVESGKYYLVGVQFNKTGDASGKVDMNDLISLSKDIVPGTYESDFATAPQIQVMNAAGGYDSYYYISDATDDQDVELGYDCWADIYGYELTDTDKLVMGSGFWFKSPTAGTITVAGEVKANANAVVAFPANKYAIISNPFPKAFSLADVVTTGVKPGTYDSDFEGASQIQVMNAAGGYDSFYYISDATDATDEYVNYDCWADIYGYILEEDTVPAGASFWIKANGAGTMGFTK